MPGLGSWRGPGASLSEGGVQGRTGAERGVCSDSCRERPAQAPAPSRLFIVPFRQFTEPVPLLAYFRDLEEELPAVVWLQDSL